VSHQLPDAGPTSSLTKARHTVTVVSRVLAVLGVVLLIVGAVLLQVDGYQADAGAMPNPWLWLLPAVGLAAAITGVVGLVLDQRAHRERQPSAE